MFCVHIIYSYTFAYIFLHICISIFIAFHILYIFIFRIHYSSDAKDLWNYSSTTRVPHIWMQFHDELNMNIALLAIPSLQSQTLKILFFIAGHYALQY